MQVPACPLPSVPASAATWGPGDGAPVALISGSHLGVSAAATFTAPRSSLARNSEVVPSRHLRESARTDPERFSGLGIKDVTGLGPLPNAKYAGRSCRPMVPLGLPALRHLFPSHGPAGPSARRRLQQGAGRSQRRGPDRAPPLCSRRNDDEPDFQVTKTRRQKEGARACRQLRGLRPLPFHSLFAQKG